VGRSTKEPGLSVATFLEIISGRRRGPLASLLRWMLWLLQAPYALAVSHRTRQFDSGKRKIHKVQVPVISVGNLTTGGTGKTPLVAWLARTLPQLPAPDAETRAPVQVVLISRGYGAKPGLVNDEAMELEKQLPGIPHLQNPDRVAAARQAIEQHHATILLLDDAFQHRRIHRDLDLVLLDALAPWGYGHLLPRGLLREPVSGLRRAQAVGLSRADLIDVAKREVIREQVERLAPEAAWFEICHRPRCLINAAGTTSPLPNKTPEETSHKTSDKISDHQPVPILAFCGLGNPEGFHRSLEQAGFRILAYQNFPDHHPYDKTDIEQLVAWCSQFPEAKKVICTRKDLVKLSQTALGSVPLEALAIEVEFLRGEAEVLGLLRRLVQSETAPK
jgi:tetraacyldisaccharide 4'-kinase